MKALLISLVLTTLVLTACKEENNTYITSPEDWQPPVLTWLTPPESDVRGTVGIDVAVHDSSVIDSVVLYVDGLREQMTNQTPYRFEVITDSLEDDDHLLEARAWDEHGNMGVSTILRVRVMNGTPEGPRLIWVPDDYERIQDAINAAADYDTIRVRDGIYYETLNLFGKGIWIESENGPLHCTVDADSSSRVFEVPPSFTPATVRGFWLTGGNYLVSIDYSMVFLFNNVFQSNTAQSLLISSYGGGNVVNNLFWGSNFAVQLGYHWGAFLNNILQDVHDVALYNAANLRNPVTHGYDLFWMNSSNYAGFEPGEGDIEGDPLLDMTNGTLFAGSPAENAGHPDIFDTDSTRSDIGPFGGPYAYNN